MSLNMKLQSSVLKNQAKNIDLELRKLDAAQSKELLAIVQVLSLMHVASP
jgi:dynactin 1